jgi:hypothetical protein
MHPNNVLFAVIFHHVSDPIHHHFSEVYYLYPKKTNRTYNFQKYIFSKIHTATNIVNANEKTSALGKY